MPSGKEYIEQRKKRLEEQAKRKELIGKNKPQRNFTPSKNIRPQGRGR